MSEFANISLAFDEDLEPAIKRLYPNYTKFLITNRSLDARGANRGKKPKFNYRVKLLNDDEAEGKVAEAFKSVDIDDVPIIVGAGPAGLFTAIRLLEYGIKSTILERGEEATKRGATISKYWKSGELNPDSNVCFGVGGAGLFSDGKLNTRSKSPHVQYVLDKLVEFGAPEDTAYIKDPHLGTNKMKLLVESISKYLKENGCEIRCNCKVESLLLEGGKCVGVKLNSDEEIKSNNIVLSTGHSARDIYKHLNDLKVSMKAKDFAIGVRVEHPRSEIDKIQLGVFAGDERLGAAFYRLSHHNEESGRGTYSFCMCPGGIVVASSSVENELVVNGMSNSARNSNWSNSAIVVSVIAGIDFDEDDPLAGIEFQKAIEERAFTLAGAGKVASQKLVDFLNDIESGSFSKSSSLTPLRSVEMKKIFPSFIIGHLKDGIREFDKKLKGFISDNAILIAPETRTSAPLTILRDRERLESISISGLYPTGEGAGYAGGITSSASDGVAVAESIVAQILH